MFKTVFAAAAVSAASAFEVVSMKMERRPRGNLKLDVCGDCLEFSNDAIGELVNFIGNNGVPEACSDLCGLIPSPFLAGACTQACDYVGIEIFVKALQKVDLDPFYFCEELKFCPMGPANADVDVVKTVAKPNPAKAGSVVDLMLDFIVKNATGPGEIQFELSAGGHTQKSTFPFDALPDGAHALNLNLNTKGAPAGSYGYLFGMCQGQCHSHHGTSKYFGNVTGTFTLTA
jgi:hypothetical protein